MQTYDIGDRRKLTCQIRDGNNVLADPTDLTFTMREPNATQTIYEYGEDVELVKDSTGIYHVSWDCTQAGVHNWRYAATGNLVVAEESNFVVRQSFV